MHKVAVSELNVQSYVEKRLQHGVFLMNYSIDVHPIRSDSL